MIIWADSKMVENLWLVISKNDMSEELLLPIIRHFYQLSAIFELGKIINQSPGKT
jgi:hypothetical protein